MALTFNKKYLLLAIILFCVEVLIALFIEDTLIRPFIGDVLVVLLIYCAVRVFLNIGYFRAALGVLIFTFAIEILQYFDYVKLLGLENNRILRVAMGRTFEWLDFGAYLVGFLIILAVEKNRAKN
jgi:hypothetical protein